MKECFEGMSWTRMQSINFGRTVQLQSQKPNDSCFEQSRKFYGFYLIKLSVFLYTADYLLTEGAYFSERRTD